MAFETLTQDQANLINNLMPGNQVSQIGTVLKDALDQLSSITDDGTSTIKFDDSITPTYGDDEALMSIGTKNVPMPVVMTDTCIPLQVNLSNTGNVAKDIAAARFKVISAAAQASVNSNVLELRHTISGNVAQWATCQVSCAPAAHTIGTGEGLVGYFAMDGTGTLTPAGSNAIAVMEVINNHTGAGVSDVAIFRNNATGHGAANIAKIENIIGTATNGLYVLRTAGTLTNGLQIAGTTTTGILLAGGTTTAISITGATTTGVSVTGTTTTGLNIAGTILNGINLSTVTTGVKSVVSTYVGTQWGDSAHHFHVAGASPRNENGMAGYFQADVTGTIAGTLYGFGSWINMLASSVAGANLICAQDNGVWADNTANVSAGQFVIGMRMEFVVNDGDNPGALYLFSTNIYANALTALFHVNAIDDMGGSTGTKSGGTARYVPFFYDQTAGVTHYVNTYTA